MAKSCIQCGNKIGLFQKPFDKIYCSPECAQAAQKEIEDKTEEAQAAKAEAELKAAEEARIAEEKREAEEAAAKLLRTCPKCRQDWAYKEGGGADGADAGKCTACGFATDFVEIKACPNCRGESLVVAPDRTTRCPVCKYRGSASD